MLECNMTLLVFAIDVCIRAAKNVRDDMASCLHFKCITYDNYKLK